MSELSKRKSCIPPTLSMGRTAIAVTTIPTPPIHCSRARHIKTPRGISSRPVMMVDPVVVMPEVASNRASVRDKFTGSKRKGSALKTESVNHAKTVKTKAPRARNVGFGAYVIVAKSAPNKVVTPPATAKARQALPSSNISTIIGMNISRPSAELIRPMTKKTGRKSGIGTP